jgi:hypothetical protein
VPISVSKEVRRSTLELSPWDSGFCEETDGRSDGVVGSHSLTEPEAW